MNLETKRNAIMNSVSGGGLYNVLKDTTWYDGYIDASGNLVASNPNGEKTTDFIDLGNNNAYLFYTEVNSSSQKWCGIAFYDSTKRAIQRNAGNTLTSGDVLPSNAQYIRFSYRTFGDSQALANLIEVDTTDTIYVGD